jgi:hypothetical protein
MQQYEYKELLDMGFKRWDGEDEIFFQCYGFRYFGLSMDLSNDVSLSWDIIERTVSVFKDGNAVEHMLSRKELNMIIKLCSYDQSR